MLSDLHIWMLVYLDTIQVKVIGESSRSQEENIPFGHEYDTIRYNIFTCA